MNIDQLKELGFKQTGHALVLVEKTISFDIVPDDNQAAPGVYLFTTVRNGPNEVNVLYCGKAGYGLCTRMRQHQGGYRAKKASDPDYQSKLHIAMNDVDAVKCQVWFRQSVNRPATEIIPGLGRDPVSLYSVDEEALLIYLRVNQEPLYNAARPPNVVGGLIANNAPEHAAQVSRPLFDAVNQQVSAYSAPAMSEAWTSALETYDDTVKDKLEDALTELERKGALQNRTAKVVKYAGGPTAGRPVLVWGALVNQKFQRYTNDLIFDIDKLYFVRYSYDKKRLRQSIRSVVPLFDYLND
jgi:hypothetical protein